MERENIKDIISGVKWYHIIIFIIVLVIIVFCLTILLILTSPLIFLYMLVKLIIDSRQFCDDEVKSVGIKRSNRISISDEVKKEKL